MKNALRPVVVLAALSSVAHGQSAPPVKMGLWQSTAVSTMTGLQLPPEVIERLKAAGRAVPGSTPRTTVMQSCFTAQKWQETLQQAQGGKDCHYKNFKQDSSGISTDTECQTQGGNSTGHTQINFLSSEKMHGTTHMEMVNARNPQPIVINATFDSVYQGSDCQGISPDSPKMISH